MKQIEGLREIINSLLRINECAEKRLQSATAQIEILQKQVNVLNETATIEKSMADVRKEKLEALHRVLKELTVCPITQEAMRDPVVLSDGNTHERRAVQHWLVGHEQSPITGKTLLHTNVYPNIAVRKLVKELSMLEAKHLSTLLNSGDKTVERDTPEVHNMKMLNGQIKAMRHKINMLVGAINNQAALKGILDFVKLQNGSSR